MLNIYPLQYVWLVWGEADVAIAVQSETLRYINDNYPISIIYQKTGLHIN